MRGRFKFEKLSKYPHMKPYDIEVWERFIAKHPNAFKRVDYDYHVGEGADFLPTGYDTPDGRQNKLYQRKIDVVGYTDNEINIIEVKPIADMASLGQALSYRDLWIEENATNKIVLPVVIAGKMSNDMELVYNKRHVVYFIV